jgi:hypothetical protein
VERIRGGVTPPDGVLQVWAQSLVRQQEQDFFKDRPYYQCLPSGPESSLGGWRRIVQTPTFIAILNENLTYRQIFMDGRRLETDPNRTWMGYSVGRWEGDALVVDSFGFNDRTWLNPRGVPHTEALRIRERYRRRDLGHMQVEVTFTDPGVLTQPWTFNVNMQLAADTEMLEAVCEFRRDHWVGKVSDSETSRRLAPETLAKYVGVYSGVSAGGPRTVAMTVSVGKLMVTINGATQPLFPQSERSFVSAEGLGYEFIGGDTGVATHVVEQHVSGAYTYARRP